MKSDNLVQKGSSTPLMARVIKDKTVSIAIPAYNRKNTIKRIINSYLRQKYLHDLIFVDDGPDDGPYEYLREKAKSHRVVQIKKHKKNLGLSASRKDGVDLATGNYILFGEDDLYLNDDYVFTLIECMDKSNTDIIAGHIVYGRAGETH